MKEDEPEKAALFKSLVQAVRNPDPDFLLKGAREMIKESGNPYYAWEAIQICIAHEKDFPDWVTAYLGDCAEAMLSDKAKKEGRDLRQALPWIFGFSNALITGKRKRGPGNLLNPGGDPDRLCFALQFGYRLELGEEPSAAMSNAYNEIFDENRDSVDVKTLRRWLLQEFNLEVWPDNADAWKKVARNRFEPALKHLFARTKSRETLT